MGSEVLGSISNLRLSKGVKPMTENYPHSKSPMLERIERDRQLDWMESAWIRFVQIVALGAGAALVARCWIWFSTQVT